MRSEQCPLKCLVRRPAVFSSAALFNRPFLVPSASARSRFRNGNDGCQQIFRIVVTAVAGDNLAEVVDAFRAAEGLTKARGSPEVGMRPTTCSRLLMSVGDTGPRSVCECWGAGDEGTCAGDCLRKSLRWRRRFARVLASSPHRPVSPCRARTGVADTLECKRYLSSASSDNYRVTFVYNARLADLSP